MNELALFAGAGGGILGGHLLGWRTVLGKDGGYLPTPTTKANWAARSMQKWPSSRNAVKCFGRVNPKIHEWMMDWPTGWTDLKPLEMDRFLQWKQ